MLLLLTLLLAQAPPATGSPQAVTPEEATEEETDEATGDARDAAAAPEPPGGQAHDPSEPAGPEPSGLDASGPEDDEPRSLDASLESAAGRMGERRLELMVRARSGEVTLMAGAETLASDRAPERRAVIIGAEVASGELSWEAELRTAPQTAGLSRLAARLGVHGDCAGFALLGRDETLRGTRLRAAGIALELEQPIDAPAEGGGKGSHWRLALSASAWLTDLRGAEPAAAGRRPRDPWSSFGAATLDWAQRWEVSLAAKRRLGPLSLTPGLGVAQPAQDGAAAARASLGLETRLGPTRLALTVAVAPLWPANLWPANVWPGRWPSSPAGPGGRAQPRPACSPVMGPPW